MLVSRGIHTHKHVRTYNYAPTRDIAENGASSSPNIVALCCSKAGAGKFFVSKSATILLVLHYTSLTMRSLTSWSTKCLRVSMCRVPFHLDFLPSR